ncbi:MAG: flavin monoamine oxidase family protein [Saprospiraceae bacterium]
MIIIIGAGLSGLLTGFRLKQKNIPFKILEARNRIGGRIHTVYGKDNTAMEMGATWFTDQHIHLKKLLEELDIDYFKQHMDNTVFYQASASSPTQIVQIPGQSPSYRIAGGSSKLINTLFEKLDRSDVLLNQSVTKIEVGETTTKVHAEKIYEGTKVVLALPPKLWAKNISFQPTLPTDLMDIAEATHTWMEDSIKVALSYDQPFWEEENIPGTLFSNAGPVTEFYDHCNLEKSKYALCGFINSSFKNLSPIERRKAVMNQIKNAFGPRTEEFTDYKECLWSNEKNTFESSEDFILPHQNNGHPIFSKTFFDDKLFISGSESAARFPGYMDGAVFSGNIIFEKIIRAINSI